MSINQQDDFGNTALMNAVSVCDLPLVKSLLQQGANPDIQNYDLIPPLEMAVYNLCPDVLLALLQGGANPNIYDFNYVSPLQYAIYLLNNNLSQEAVAIILVMVKHLLDFKADPNIIDNTLGMCPIHFAILRGMVSLVKILLAGGANPNLEDSDGSNPLIYAVYQNNEEILKLLIAAGGLNVEGIFAKTPLEFAIFFGFSNLANILQNIERSKNRVQPTCCKRIMMKPGKCMSFIFDSKQ